MPNLNLLLPQAIAVNCLKRVMLERGSKNPRWSDGKIAQVKPLLEICDLLKTEYVYIGLKIEAEDSS